MIFILTYSTVVYSRSLTEWYFYGYRICLTNLTWYYLELKTSFKKDNSRQKHPEAGMLLSY